MPTTVTGCPTITAANHPNAFETIEWNLDPNTNRVRVYFETGAGRVGFTATEGSAFGSLDYVDVAADTFFEIVFDRTDKRLSDLTIYTSVLVGDTIVRLLVDKGG